MNVVALEAETFRSFQPTGYDVNYVINRLIIKCEKDLQDAIGRMLAEELPIIHGGAAMQHPADIIVSITHRVVPEDELVVKVMKTRMTGKTKNNRYYLAEPFSLLDKPKPKVSITLCAKSSHPSLTPLTGALPPSSWQDPLSKD